MKKILTILSGVVILGMLLSLESCTKGWEDLNEDPNNPTEVPATNILANTLQYFGDGFFDPWFSMNNTGTYAGHLGKIQYIDESRYFERESVINSQWNIVYRAVKDIKNAKAIAAKAGQKNLVAVATTLEAYMFLIATDSWRNIPFSEAGLGDEGILKPIYDDQSTIYPALLDSLKKAGDIFAEGNLDALGDGDLLYGGSVAGWQKFCNSLRVRIANRMYGVSAATATTHLTEVFNNAATYPVFTSNDDNAYLYWPGAAPYKEPWFADSETRDDHAMGSYLIDEMVALADPRLPVYAKANEDGIYNGVVPGIADEDMLGLAKYSRIGDRFRGDASGFTPFMNYAELLFIKAEAILNGVIGGDAQATFANGVKASLNENGVSNDAWADALGDITADNSILYLQKWIALFKNSHEAWAEARRTDVPLMAQAPANAARFTGHDRPPFRFPYPGDESNLNNANLEPELNKTVDKFWGEQMWWDTRSGIN